MADGLCSESDRETFVGNLINENVLRTNGNCEKCVKGANADSMASVTDIPDVAEIEKCALDCVKKMMGAKQVEKQQQQQQQSQKMSAEKQSKFAPTLMAASVAASKDVSVSVSVSSANASKLPTIIAESVAVVGNKVNCGRAEMIAPKVKSVVNSSSVQKQQQQRLAKNGLAHVDKPGCGGGGGSGHAGTTEIGKKHLQQQQQPEADENPSAKKKRCSDRYDSSESSDSGVATLSCTDSSTTSSDASDPGSPYSPVSLSDDAHQSSKANMSPQIIPITQNQRVQAQQHQQLLLQHQQQTTATVQHQWPWSIPLSNAINNHNNNIVNASNRNSVNTALTNSVGKTKRISGNQSDIHSTAKRIRTSTSAERLSAGLSAATTKRLKAQEESQTKITGYFKSQMKPLKAIKQDISNLIARTAEAQSAVLDKYFNVFAKTTATVTAKEEKDRKAIAIKKDLPPLQAMSSSPSSLKKVERKTTTKVAQVAPISRKTSVPQSQQQHQQPKPPKKHIAIAPRIADSKTPAANAKQISTNFQTDQTKISQPTVLLTTIRIPPQATSGHGQTQQQQQLGANVLPPKATPLTSAKVGSMLQIPIVPNLVQIPNILSPNGTNLVMNNGQLARVANGSQYFLNGALLKLQQITNSQTGTTSSTNGILTMDPSALQGNLLLKPSAAIPPGVPIATGPNVSKASVTIPQPIMTQASQVGSNTVHPTFLTNQRIPTQPVLMATSAGWYVLNQSATTESLTNNIPHQTLSPTMMCKSRTVTSLTSTLNPPVPPLVTLTNKHDVISPSSPKSIMSTPNIVVDEPSSTEVRSEKVNSINSDKGKPLSIDCSVACDKTDVIVATDIMTTTATCSIKIDSPKPAITLKVSPTSTTTISAQTIEIVAKDIITPKCAISPILSQPKTIRFPVPSNCDASGSYRIGPKGIKRHDGVCYWDQCNDKYDTSSKLLDHLQTQHVNTQTGPFSCLWSGCKVRGRESCSRRWLERHVLSHGGTKPFKCIVDGCGLRLGSQLALQKHVNSHFNATESKDAPSKRTSDPPVPKLLRKNGKKLRYRRQPFSARMFDYFDTGIMEGLQHRLMIASSYANASKGTITFQGQSMARRTTATGSTELYVKWIPNEIIPDEWISETKCALTKTIPIQSMRYQERFALQKYLKAASLKSDISINSISPKTAQLLPNVTALLSTALSSSSSSLSSSTTSSSLFGSSGSSSGSTNNDDGNVNLSSLCNRKKQSRKTPKRSPLQPS